MVEWETGEITEEPLSLIAADDPVTCAIYAKTRDLLHLDGWKRLKHIARMPQMDTRKPGFTSSLLSNMMADTRLDWLLEDISLQIPLKASTLELSPSDPLDWLYS